MGEVSYKLMEIIIVRKMERELHATVKKYQDMANQVDKNDPRFNEILLNYSNQMFEEMGKIKAKYTKEYASLGSEVK